MRGASPVKGNQSFSDEVISRFGVLPNFFCSAPPAEGLVEELWKFAKSAYLDCSLPSLFKERLFVHLSRFCEVRYCIVRHVGFLIGEGHPAGDASALPQTIEQVLTVLRRPLPDADGLSHCFQRLESYEQPVEMPEPETQLEGDLFDALTIMFVEPHVRSVQGAPWHAHLGRAGSKSSLHSWRSYGRHTTGQRPTRRWPTSPTCSQ